MGRTQSGKSAFLKSYKEYTDGFCATDASRVGAGTYSHTAAIPGDTLTKDLPSYSVCNNSIRVDKQDYTVMGDVEKICEEEKNQSLALGAIDCLLTDIKSRQPSASWRTLHTIKACLEGGKVPEENALNRIEGSKEGGKTEGAVARVQVGGGRGGGGGGVDGGGGVIHVKVKSTQAHEEAIKALMDAIAKGGNVQTVAAKVAAAASRGSRQSRLMIEEGYVPVKALAGAQAEQGVLTNGSKKKKKKKKKAKGKGSIAKKCQGEE